MHARRSCGGNVHVLVCVWEATVASLFMARAQLHDDPIRFQLDWERYNVSHDLDYVRGHLNDLRGHDVAGEWETI